MVRDPIRVTPVLTAGQTTPVVDTTAQGAAHKAWGPVVTASVGVAVYPTGQAVTAQMLYLVGGVLRVADTQACPAGQLTTKTFTPQVAHFRVEILNGGTGPTTLDVAAAMAHDD